MTHVLTLVDAKPEFHKTFLDWLHKRQKLYGNDCFLVEREIKLYEISTNEKYKTQLINDLLAFQGSRLTYPKRLINWLLKLIKLKDKKFSPIDKSKYKPSDKKTIGQKSASGKGNWYTLLLGEAEDEKNKNGGELL